LNKRVFLFLLALIFLPCVGAFAQEAGNIPIPTINFNIEEARSPQEVALSLQVIFLITIISLAPTLLILITSFVRVYIVFSFVSRGLATQTIPPNNIIVGLSLFLTLFIMFPVFNRSYQDGVRPYLDGEIVLEEGYNRAIEPVREFMFKQTSERYIYRFVRLANIERPGNPSEVPTYVLIPAFILNELTLSFYMGMLILIPFTVIDVVVASTLMSMGILMLPPIMISFPLKILLFILVDGWDLLVEKLVLSFG
jgi:flagellar biosynthetic protein FliP